MDNMADDSTCKMQPGEVRVSGLLESGKPYLFLSKNAQIIDCDEVFIKLVKISKSDLLSSELSAHRLNKKFINAVQKAATAGISTFRGNVILGNVLLPVFLETIFMKVESETLPYIKIGCIVLDSAISETSNLQELPADDAIPLTIDSTDASVSLHTMEGEALYISPSIETMLGYSREDLQGMDPFAIVHPEDVHIVKNVLEKIGKNSDHLNSHYRMVHKNGSILLVESSSYLISDVHGKGKHIVNVTWDRSSLTTIRLALERSEQKYYRLVMNLPTGISLISTNGKLLEVNDAMKKIMGLPTDTPLPDMNFFNIEAMKRFNITDQLSFCIGKKEIVNGNISLRINDKDNAKLLTYSFVPVLNIYKEVDVVIGYVSDLTQQMKAELESHEQAEFLNLVINSIKSPFFVKDEEHKWVMLNDAAVEMMGQPREKLIGKSDYDLYSKEQADNFWKYDELVFKTGSNTNEEQITWSDGTLHTIVTYKQQYTEKSSGKKFIVGTIHDISSYKKIEEELRTSELKYHELFDNANDFILTMDMDGNITNANRTLLNFLKTDLEAFLQHNIFEYITYDNIESAYAFRDKLLAGSFDGVTEIKALGLDGQPVTYEVKASQIKQNEVLTGVQCVFSDITQRREATLKLEKYSRDLLELNKTKDKFFSIIAHDLRNPYSSMIGFSEILLEDLDQLSQDEIKESVKIIHTSAKNSFNLLDNLLSWSRLETGHMVFAPVRIVLIEVIEEVTNILFSMAYRKKIEINNLASPDILLSADKNMLNTILNNLIMNAIKYTSTGGSISIYAELQVPASESEQRFVKISVADSGVGMDTETLEILFTANKLISHPGTEKEQGTGMGLMLTREMIEKHGGSIMAESTLGRGSVFSFFIPAFNQNDIIF